MYCVDRLVYIVEMEEIARSTMIAITAIKMRSIASVCAVVVKNWKIREVGNKSLAGDLSFGVNLPTF